MRVHHLQHVPFEGLASMGPALSARGHALAETHLYRGDPLPPLDTLDWLIVMGGPMGVHDGDRHSWLAAEKDFIGRAIAARKIVLGICLGAQLIADVLGARVEQNRWREIGWHPVSLTPEAADTEWVAGTLPGIFEAFHWHGDRFEIPRGALPLATSEACATQGFVLDGRVAGLQFHLESTADSVRSLIENCREDLDGSRYVQNEGEMLADPARFARINGLMGSFLSALESNAA